MIHVETVDSPGFSGMQRAALVMSQQEISDVVECWPTVDEMTRLANALEFSSLRDVIQAVWEEVRDR
jgi:hypothetical protein